MKFTFDVQGLTELAAALEAMSHRYSRALLIQCLREAAEPLARRMGELAPRAPGGHVHLADEIVISLSRGEDVQEAAVAVGPAKGETFYGGLVEFGTAHTSAWPFARPAFDTETDEMLEILAALLWRELVGVASTHAPSMPTGGPGGGGLV